MSAMDNEINICELFMSCASADEEPAKMMMPGCAEFEAIEKATKDDLRKYMGGISHAIKAPKNIFEMFAKSMGWLGISYFQMTKALIATYAQMPLGQFTYAHILNFKYGNHTESERKMWRMGLRKEVLVPAMEKGWLPDHLLDRSMYDRLLREYRKAGSGIKKKERTVLWYAFEWHLKKSSKGFSLTGRTTPQRKQAFMNVFSEFKDVKACDFNARHLRKMKEKAVSGGRFAYVPVVRMMVTDGVCDSNIFELEKYSRHINRREDNVWEYGVRAKIDLNLIDEGFREAFRVYAWEVTNQGTRALQAGFSVHQDLFSLLRKMGANGIGEIDGNVQKKLYVELRRMHNSGRKEAKKYLKIFRKLLKTVRDKSSIRIDPSVALERDGFSLKDKKGEIYTYSDEEMEAIIDIAKTHHDRLIGCAIGLLALFARRISEIVSRNESYCVTGLRIDSLRKVGITGELALSYVSSKQNKELVIPLFSFVGKRNDPFAREIEVLGPALFEEAKQITAEYRHLVPDAHKDFLFVEPKRCGGFGVLNGGVLRKKFIKAMKERGMFDRNKSFHEFRHTMATRIIMAGGTVGDAADALGDTENVVAAHYVAYLDRIDIIRQFASMGRVSMVEPLEDSRYFINKKKNVPSVVASEDLPSGCNSCTGGFCDASYAEMIQCPSYRMINGANGCPGCKSFHIVATINRPYWEARRREKLRDMDAADKGSIFFDLARKGFEQANEILEMMEQRRLEDECGIR